MDKFPNADQKAALESPGGIILKDFFALAWKIAAKRGLESYAPVYVFFPMDKETPIRGRLTVSDRLESRSVELVPMAIWPSKVIPFYTRYGKFDKDTKQEVYDSMGTGINVSLATYDDYCTHLQQKAEDVFDYLLHGKITDVELKNAENEAEVATKH